jgi:methyl-accepting chemotaxis protein
MLKRFRFTVGGKIYAIIALSFAGFVTVLMFQMQELSRGLQDQKQLELQHLAEVATNIAQQEFAEAQAGKVSSAEAQKRAAPRIGELRYGQNDYFWINDLDGVMILHPINAKLNGTNVIDFKDPTGKRLFAEMIDLVKRDGRGMVPYMWPKPGKTEPQPKLSYVAGFKSWNWLIGTGVYVDDLNEQVWSVARRALVMAGLALSIIGAISIFVSRRMSRAMRAMTGAMGELASGNFGVVLPGLGRGDEIGDMAGAVEAFKVMAVEKAQREAQEKEAESHAAAVARKAEMNKLANQFETAVGDIISTVSSASTELEASAGTLTRTAETTQRLSANVAAASEQASANVQSVASATEELGASVNEISRQVHESSQIADAAVKQAETTNQRIKALSEAAGRIGDVVKLITAIAEQTNLLALNATIEAARAGEAGRGFAVVASEVKSLATQTAKATEEISSQIGAMQSATRESVGAIEEIGGTIGRISTIAAAIAASVEEQGAATTEIARNVQEAATGSSQVAANITDVNRGAGETGSASAEVLSSAQSLARESTLLKVEVEKFLVTVRAA